MTRKIRSELTGQTLYEHERVSLCVETTEADGRRWVGAWDTWLVGAPKVGAEWTLPSARGNITKRVLSAGKTYTVKSDHP